MPGQCAAQETNLGTIAGSEYGRSSSSLDTDMIG
jgi:hypothetical protein